MTAFTPDVFINTSNFAGLLFARYCCDNGASTVTMCEPTNHKYGMWTAGLTKVDIVGQPDNPTRNSRWGLQKDVYTWIGANRYGRTDGLEQINHTYQEALDAIAAVVFDPRITIKLGTRIRRTKDGYVKDPVTKALKSWSVENLDTYASAIYADASYEQDMVAAAGVRMNSGRDSVYHFPSVIQNPDKQTPPATTMAGFNPTPDGRIFRPWLRCPRQPLSRHDPAAATVDAARRRLRAEQAYGFRPQFNNGPNRVSFSTYKSDGYRRADFVWILKRIADAGVMNSDGTVRNTATWNNVLGYSLYPNPFKPANADNPGGPAGINADHKFITNGGDTPQFSNGWEKLSYAARDKVALKAAWFIIDCLYFMATDSSIPAAYQAQINLLGWDPDDFQTDFLGCPGFCGMFYARQSRNHLGPKIMTSRDMIDDDTGTLNWQKPNGISGGGYNPDAHNYYEYATPDGGSQEEGRQYYRDVSQWTFPFDALLPDPSQVTNLYPLWAFSGSTQFVNSSRVEPTAGVIAQAAALHAMIAFSTGRLPSQVPFAELQPLLAALNVPILFP